MTKFRKLLDQEPLEADPGSSGTELQPQLPRSHSSSPQIPEKVLIAPRRKSLAQSLGPPDPAPRLSSRPKQISAQAYRLAPVYRQQAIDPERVSVTLEVNATILQQTQQILACSEGGSLSALMESLLSEWIQAQED